MPPALEQSVVRAYSELSPSENSQAAGSARGQWLGRVSSSQREDRLVEGQGLKAGPLETHSQQSCSAQFEGGSVTLSAKGEGRNKKDSASEKLIGT